MNIAIDGPAGAGKSTVARLTAQQLGYTYIDTGAMYRAVTYAALNEQVPMDQEEAISKLVKKLSFRFIQHELGQFVVLNDIDITEQIRHPNVTANVSVIASYRSVRDELMHWQLRMAEQGNVVMDGRDIGTEVLPNAEVKIFLTASIQERALRRYRELETKGYKPDLAELQEDIAKRDQHDSEREIAPLRRAADAIMLDSTGMTIEQVVSRIVTLAREKLEPS
jgi:cytidylate kinase